MSSEEDHNSTPLSNGDESHTLGRERGRGSGGRGRGNRSKGNNHQQQINHQQTTNENSNHEQLTSDHSIENNGESFDSPSSRGRVRGGGRGRFNRGRGGRGGGGGGGGGPFSHRQRTLKEVPPPDESLHSSHQSAHQTTTADLQRQIGAFTTKIESAVKIRKGIRSSIKQQQSLLSSIQSEKSSLFQEYTKINDHINSLESALIQQHRQLETAKRELPYLTTLELDTHIKTLERQIAARQLPPDKKPEADDKLKQLRSIRPKVYEYEKKQKLEQTQKIDESDIQGFITEREAIQQTAYQKKEEEENQKKELEKLMSQEKGLTIEIEEWIASRRLLHDRHLQVIREFEISEERYLNEKKSYDSYIREKQYYENQELLKAQQQAEYEARVARREWIAQMKAEREEAAAQREEEEELTKDPYETEKHTIHELIRYLSNLSLKHPQTSTTENTEEDTDELNSHNSNLNEDELSMNGETTLSSTRNSNFSGKSVKVVDAKKKKDSLYEEVVIQKQPKKVKAKKQQKVLTHVADVFAMFRTVEIDPPMLITDVPSIIQQLKDKEQDYENAPRPTKKQPKKQQQTQNQHRTAKETEATEETTKESTDKVDTPELPIDGNEDD